MVIQFTNEGRPHAIDVDYQGDGDFVIDKEKAPKGTNSRVYRIGKGTALSTVDASNKSISQTEGNDNTTGGKNSGEESNSQKARDSYSTRAVVERALETAEEGSAERAALEAYKRLIDRIEEQAYQAETARKSKNTAGETAASENLAAVSENRESLSCKDSRISADDGIRSRSRGRSRRAPPVADEAKTGSAQRSKSRAAPRRIAISGTASRAVLSLNAKS